MHDRLLRILLLLCPVALGACALLSPLGLSKSSSNRPDGEGYAGSGELVLRIGLDANEDLPFSMLGLGKSQAKRASVELRYLGLDAFGRAVFERHDVDALAGDPQFPRSLPTLADAGGQSGTAVEPQLPDTRQIVLDLRRTRQIHIQGKTIEIVDASPSGVVFHLY